MSEKSRIFYFDCVIYVTQLSYKHRTVDDLALSVCRSVSVVRQLRIHVWLFWHLIIYVYVSPAFSLVAHWNKDFKPDLYPETEEARRLAAKKYGLQPEEYKPYPDDGQCNTNNSHFVVFNWQFSILFLLLLFDIGN